jgi:choline dehydrogenase-like flavoprotein
MDYLRASASTVFHPSGTCRMGSDDASVLTPDLKVRGLKGLRVADTSIMPHAYQRQHQRPYHDDRRQGR